jgi:DNA topoisomerase-2
MEKPTPEKPQMRRGKTIEQIYQKKSQLEHILLRPDTYVGSTELQDEKLWVFDEVKQRMVYRDVKFVPAFYKIFDEILVNAADNYQRDDSMTYIKVNISEEEGWISVENNGTTLPVEVHKVHKMHVPQMVFGHLLTSDNYDDDEQKVTGGRNGYGAKLTNIFSKKFTIECCDNERGSKYVQSWENNMSVMGKPKITKWDKKDHTKVTFYPDFAKFGLTKLDQDHLALFKKRVMDCAGSTNKKVKVFFNDIQVPVKEFKDYVDLYFDEGAEITKIYDKSGDRWEFVVAISDGQFQQVSFVNAINTFKGGTHVMHVADQFVEAIHKKANAKNKGGMAIKPFHVRSHLWVFVNALIVNPTFDSQTKETLTLKMSKFGSKCEVSDSTINKLIKTGIVDTVLQWAKAKESIDMQKKMKATGSRSRIIGVPKLEDANWAGTKASEECTLILTEGDSAKALAMAGISVVGRDSWGVFPLRGKPLNVREANFQQTMGNQEIQNMIKILGLDQKKEYDSAKGLRYGSVMIMADQDYDGSHIKGLLINMIHHWWPSLFKLPGFLKEFATPIVKVTKGPQEMQFFTLQDYEKWKDANKGGRGWAIKYYKGLGTSTSKEGKEYFKNILDHELCFKWTSSRDDEAIDLAFNKKRADDRKDWINSYREGETVDHSKEFVSYSDFVNKELVCFSKYDVMRSIPSMVDGFKPTQRKIMFCAFKRNLQSDVKVAQLAGYIAEHSAYHHGEVSLQGTLVSMAQSFVGSNNINLLVPSGQFGTRLMGGKDAASARYIYTRLDRIARIIFHSDDDSLLDFQVEEGQSIEPRWYMPVIPMVLVNGADGIGTGWSTSLPNYNPREIIKQLKRFIKGKPIESISPWYKGFQGSITASESEDKTGYEVVGCAKKSSPTSIEVTELPVRRWTQDYKEFLTKLVDADGEGKGSRVEDFQEYHAENTVHFTINASRTQMKALEEEGIEKALKMRSSLSTNNIVFFDADGKIKKYSSEKELLTEFAELRLKYYQKRKDFHLDRLRRDKELLDAKVRFVLMVISGEIIVSNRKKADLLVDLRAKKFKSYHEIFSKEPAGATSSEGSEKGGAFDYLLGMPIWSLTMERVEKLKQESKHKTEEYKNLEKSTIQDLWETDLDAILAELKAIDDFEEELRAEEEELKKSGKRGRGQAKPTRRPRRRGEAAAEKKEEEDEEHEEEEPAAPSKRRKEAAPKDESTNDFLARLKERQKLRAKLEMPAKKKARVS